MIRGVYYVHNIYFKYMKILIHWLLSALAVLITAYILPGITVQSFLVALIVSVVLGFLNTFIRPALIVLSLPLEIATLGLFTLVINGALVLLASVLVPGFKVASFWWALAFSVILWVVNSVLHSVEHKGEEERG